MTLSPPCELLGWDSEFFGVPIARVRSDQVDPELAPAIDRWCRSQGVRCLYFLARSDDARTTQVAEQYGYHLVDVRVTFECALEPAPAGAAAADLSIRSAEADDLPTLKQIARSSYRDSRFFYDRHFPADRSEALYERWVEASCEGYADAVLVAGRVGAPAGFISCHLDGGRVEGRIGLVGVADTARGGGVGQALVRRAVEWFAGEGLLRASVVTQGRNIPAQRLYQRAGFLTRKVQLYYHKWYTPQNAHE